jgi:opacity protein-like surface antigen
MKIVKNTILASMLIAGLGSTAIADNLEEGSGKFAGLTWSPNTNDGTIEGYEFDGSGMLGFLGGNKKLITDSVGGYFDFDMSYETVDETDTSKKVIYSYTIANLGITYSPIDNLTLFGGIGYTWEKGKYTYYGTNYESDEDHNQINFHLGTMYKITDTFGLVVGYNTAPSAINYGFSVEF